MENITDKGANACKYIEGTINSIAPLSKWETEEPFNLAFPLTRIQPKSNPVYEAREIQISEGRGKEADFSLDVHGFEFLQMAPGDTLRDGDAIKNEYLSLMESLLRDHLGVERVVCFDYALWEVRRDLMEGEFVEWHDKTPAARNARTDQKPEAAMSRLRLYFEDDAEVLIKSRHLAPLDPASERHSTRRPGRSNTNR
ncbi:hypothetical protein NUW58_g1919 [Xylaria curta]|uniref:Uncharacterized protein n=1 Tax=Xylaria curta TaxID=42375 RepID=A0ACC1PJ92_9PEZI|nr:hypothetical protein NUW58_g1919 [Xylaria curta]